MDEMLEIKDLQAKALFKAAREMEKKHGASIEEILIGIIYESEDDMARVNAIRTFFAVMGMSSLDFDTLLDEPDLAEVFSLRRGDDG